MASKQGVLAWEERWSRPAGIASLLAVLFVAASLIAAAQIEGSGAERMLGVDNDPGTQILSGILIAIGFLLLIPPLYFMFRAARARSDRVRRQLVGVVIVGPLFFAAASVVLGFATVEGAETFVDDQVQVLEKEDVRLDSDDADEKARETVSEASLSSLGAGLQFAGLIGFVFGFFYSALWAMRTGLLTRFWGSLGVALAAVSIFAPVSAFFIFLAFLWFVYFGLLLLGTVPGGRPPAWHSGEAEPWPTPGEKAAAEMQSRPGIPGREAEEMPDDSPERGEGHDLTPPEPSEGKPKKRKQRG